MKKYLKDGDATATGYEDFASPPHEGDQQAPDLRRSSLLSLTRTKQFPDEMVTQFRSRLERLVGKAYHHLPAKDREPMNISLFAYGLLVFRLAEYVPYILYRDLGRRTTTHRNVAAQGDHHIRDHSVELYQGLCNIPGIRRKNFTRNFPGKKSKSKIV